MRPDHLRRYIEVTSFFELCQEYLNFFEDNADKLFDDVTWKTGEHIDHIWREYYRCRFNNFDALEFIDIHKRFNQRSILAEEYLRDELDWIRSRYSKNERKNYIRAERKGRHFSIPAEWRNKILNGLSNWEQKMFDIGIIDYLGLSVKLLEHLEKIEPCHSHILIDEVQDFGIIEMKIIRMLVEEGPKIFSWQVMKIRRLL